MQVMQVICKRTKTDHLLCMHVFVVQRYDCKDYISVYDARGWQQLQHFQVGATLRWTGNSSDSKIVPYNVQGRNSDLKYIEI